MKGAAQKIVFAARARKHRAEFAVGKHPAQRDDAADGPQQQDRKAGRDVLDLKAEAGEDADAYHVGDDDGGRHDHRNGGPAFALSTAINRIVSTAAPALRDCLKAITCSDHPCLRFSALEWAQNNGLETPAIPQAMELGMIALPPSADAETATPPHAKSFSKEKQ